MTPDLSPRFTARARVAALFSLAAASALVTACGGGDDSPAPAAAPTPAPAPVALTCDDTMKTAFQPDANTTVLLVKAFKKGRSP